MDAAERPPVPPRLRGFELVDRSHVSDRPHHLAPRNGGAVAARLAECSLYQPKLDLAIYSPDGEAVTYGVFWADPVTGVGLVEPMRTEDAYQGHGLARHLIAVGLDRLARAGCSRMKVSYDPLNVPAKHLYLGAGFHPVSTTRSYLRGA
jgi:GNAT superfamily N-acetyltransferase